MAKYEKSFWELTKRVAGQPRASNKAAPDVEQLVDHFVKKMSNAADAESNSWKPADGKTKRTVSFKVEFKQVVKSLQKLDVSKSVNSIANHLLKRCAQEIAPSLDKLFKFIVKKAEYPSFWKTGRITALHKRKSEFTINRLNYGWNRPFLNLCHLLCGMPHVGCRGLGRRGNAFLSAGFGSSSPDRAGRAPARGGGNRVGAKIAPQLPGSVH